MSQNAHSSKTKFLDAALSLVRVKGYTATTIDDVCQSAELTKGSFFHHFKNKEELAVEAAQHWSKVTGGLFALAPYTKFTDPLDRVLGYVDFRKAIIQGEVPQFTCFVGTMAQEIHQTNPAIRAACDASIREHAARVEADIELAMAQHQIKADFTAESLALHTQAVLQGAFILAKAENGQETAKECISHLRRYIELLFEGPAQEEQYHGQ
jgi:TetR/AcrR family transcriptional regulator, transcriptional repressor for nem operon